MDATTNLVYITDPLGATLSVIDGATNRVATTANIGKAPVAVAVNTTTKRIYVANKAGNSVTVVH